MLPLSNTLKLALGTIALGLLLILGLFGFPQVYTDAGTLGQALGIYETLCMSLLGALTALGGVYGGRHLRLSGPGAPTSAELQGPQE